MKKNSHASIYKLTLGAILAALVVVLQVFAGSIKIGTFSITLTLIPVILGACLMNEKFGAMLGCLFGIVVAIFCVSGLDVGGNIMFNARPALTIIVCLVKGAAAGWVSGLLYRVLSKKMGHAAVFVAAASAPIVNTGLFCIALALFYNDILVSWAGGTNALVYVFTGLIGVNFIIEFAINIIFAPAISTVIKAVRKEIR